MVPTRIVPSKQSASLRSAIPRIKTANIKAPSSAVAPAASSSTSSSTSSVPRSEQLPPSGRFVSFTDAKKYMKTVNVTRWSEYKAWTTTSRPDFIPGSPSRTYKDHGWISYPDFCGYPPVGEARIVRRNDFEKVSHAGIFLYSKGTEDLKAFIEAKLDTDYEYRDVPHKLSINLLVRHRKHSFTSDGEVGWVGLRVFREHKERQMYRFTHTDVMPGAISCYARWNGAEFVLGAFSPQGKRTFSFPKDVFDSLSTMFTSDVEEACKNVNKLRGFWDWLLETEGTNATMITHMKALHDAYRGLYRHAGLDLCFASPADQARGHFNSLLGNLKCIHKHAQRHTGRTCYYLRLWVRSKVQAHATLHEKDPFDLVVASIYHQDTCAFDGVFVLPKSVLAGHLETEEKVGKSAFHFYPPFMNPPMKAGRARQEAHAQYYIPCNGSICPKERVEKLMNILMSNGLNPSRVENLQDPVPSSKATA